MESMKNFCTPSQACRAGEYVSLLSYNVDVKGAYARTRCGATFQTPNPVQSDTYASPI